MKSFHKMIKNPDSRLIYSSVVCFSSFTQELSKITMPIVLNEPLSFLQRITEYMEHTYLVNKACSLPDSIERMQVRHTHVQQYKLSVLLMTLWRELKY